MAGEQPTEALRKELVGWVRKEIGPIAAPDLIQFAPGLPKTRSGKIMRRILRKIAEDEFGNLGDTSTLADPAVVDDLVNNRQNKRTRVRDHARAHSIVELVYFMARGCRQRARSASATRFPASFSRELQSPRRWSRQGSRIGLFDHPLRVQEANCDDMIGGRATAI